MWRWVCAAVVALAPLVHAQTGNLGPSEVDVKRPNTAVTAADRAMVCALSPNGVSIGIAGTVNQGTPNTLTNGWPVKVTDGTNQCTVTGAGALKVDGSAVTQPVSGTVTSNQGGAPWTTRLQDGVGAPLATVTGANALKVDGSAVTQPVSGTVTATPPTQPTTAGLSNVSVTTSTTTVLASNANRRAAAIWNDDTTNAAFVQLGSSASSTSFTVKLQPSDYYEVPAPTYTGAITAVSSAGTVVLRVTEVTP